MSASMKRRHLGHLQLLSRAVSPFTVVAEMEVSPQDVLPNPQGMIVLPAERHGLPEDSVYFRVLCGVHSSPLAFAPNRSFACVWSVPGSGTGRDSVFHVCALLS